MVALEEKAKRWQATVVAHSGVQFCFCPCLGALEFIPKLLSTISHPVDDHSENFYTNMWMSPLVVHLPYGCVAAASSFALHVLRGDGDLGHGIGHQPRVQRGHVVQQAEHATRTPRQVASYKRRQRLHQGP